MHTAADWKSPTFIGGRRLSFPDQLPFGDCNDMMARAAASVAALFGTPFMPKSTSSHAVLGALTTPLRSISRSGDGVIDGGSCGTSFGTARPRLRAKPTAADGRSCE